MRVFFVFCDAKKGNPTWDTFRGAFATLEEAIKAADVEWRYMTDRERAKCTVWTGRADGLPDGTPLRDAFDLFCESTGDGGLYVEYTLE